MKQTTNTKKLALAGVLTALAIVGSFLSFPVAGSKCAPVQHMVNMIPFLISTVAGSILAFLLISVFQKSGVMAQLFPTS